MSDRVLIWHIPHPGEPLPVYYAETDYKPVALRIYAERVPDAQDLRVDVLDDGVSIMNSSGRSSHATLPKTRQADAIAEDFIRGVYIQEGSWISLDVLALAGANNVTVQLELEALGIGQEARVRAEGR